MTRLNSLPDSQVLSALPVLPLPNVVLLPGMMLPLNVHEPRYLELVDFVRQTGQHIGVPLLCPGAPGTPPPLEPVLGVGRLVFHLALPDGRRIIRLEGVGRVRVQHERATGRSFRELAVTPLDEPPPTDLGQMHALRDQIQRLAHCCGDDSESLLSLLHLRDDRVLLYTLTSFLPSLELLPCDIHEWIHDEHQLVSLQQRSLAAEDPDARAHFLLERVATIVARLGQPRLHTGSMPN